jgi:hypothetical protein
MTADTPDPRPDERTDAQALYDYVAHHRPVSPPSELTALTPEEEAKLRDEAGRMWLDPERRTSAWSNFTMRRLLLTLDAARAAPRADEYITLFHGHHPNCPYTIEGDWSACRCGAAPRADAGTLREAVARRHTREPMTYIEADHCRQCRLPWPCPEAALLAALAASSPATAGRDVDE